EQRNTNNRRNDRHIKRDYEADYRRAEGPDKSSPYDLPPAPYACQRRQTGFFIFSAVFKIQQPGVGHLPYKKTKTKRSKYRGKKHSSAAYPSYGRRRRPG